MRFVNKSHMAVTHIILSYVSNQYSCRNREKQIEASKNKSHLNSLPEEKAKIKTIPHLALENSDVWLHVRYAWQELLAFMMN